MPKVVISFDPEFGEYDVDTTWEEPLTEYEALVFMKASHYRNIQKNLARAHKDQEFLEKFFIEAQMSGRVISEQ